MAIHLRINSLLLMVYLFGCNSIAQNETSTIDAIAERYIANETLPSLAIGIVQDGEIVFFKAFGYADVESKSPATVETIYQLGSVSKTLTGHLLATLIVTGDIELNAPIQSFFPDSVIFPKDETGKEISLRDIATHSAGIPRYPSNLDRIDPDPILGYSTFQMYTNIPQISLDTLVGTRYDYSNYGYGIIGTALENKTEESLSTLFKRYIFSPYQMKNSSLFLNEKIQKNLATPYLEVAPYELTKPWNMESLAAAGNVFSNVTDLSNFMIGMMKETEVNDVQQKPYFKINERLSYGLGCFIVDSEKYRTQTINHGGDIDGYSSVIQLFPEYKNLGVVILTNHGSGHAFGPVVNDLMKAIVKEYAGVMPHE